MYFCFTDYYILIGNREWSFLHDIIIVSFPIWPYQYDCDQ